MSQDTASGVQRHHTVGPVGLEPNLRIKRTIGLSAVLTRENGGQR